MILKTISTIVALFLTAAWSLPTFTQKPALTQIGDSVAIRFAVSEYTVVTVEAVDSQNPAKVLCHIVSGKLGTNPPAPLVANALSQTLYWNKKDDDGLPVSTAYDIKVGLGLKAVYDRDYGWNGNKSIVQMAGANVKGMAVDSNRNLIVLASAGEAGSGSRSATRIVMFSSETGDYIKTIYPYPNALPEARLKGFGRATRSDGKQIPIVYQGHMGDIVPDVMGIARQGMSVTSKNWILFVTGIGGYTGGVNATAGHRVLIMNSDGSCPRDTFYGPQISTVFADKIGTQLAVSPDGRNVYAAGVTGKFCVYRGPVDAVAPLAPWLGNETVSGNDSVHFGEPVGVDADGRGMVYVADSVGNRIMVFDTAGSFLMSRAAGPGLSMLRVNPATGAVYVMRLIPVSGGWQTKVVKYSAYPVMDSICTVTLARVYNRYSLPNMAVDWRRSFPRIWIGSLANDVQAYDDKGSAITASGVMLGGNDTRLPMRTMGAAMNAPCYIAVDPRERYLYQGINNMTRISLATGVISTTKIKDYEVAVGGDGSVYGITEYFGHLDTSLINKYDSNENKIDFSAGIPSIVVPRNYFPGPTNGGRGFVVARNGDIYQMTNLHGHNLTSTPDAANTRLRHYNKLGQLLDTNLLTCPEPAAAPGVDKKGNLYVTFNTKPNTPEYTYTETFKNHPYFPDPFALAPAARYRCEIWPYATMNYTLYQVGSLYKFPPSGGSILVNGLLTTAVPVGGSLDTVPFSQISDDYYAGRTITGATWQYFGVSPAIGHGGGHSNCTCVGMRYAIDDYSRIFIPNTFEFQVKVLDENKNELLKIGEYGNPDDPQGGETIRYAWPLYVQRAGNHVYVGDVQAQRISRSTLLFDSWATTSGLSGVDGDLSLDNGTLKKNPIPGLRLAPNPFNPSTTLTMDGKIGASELKVYDIRGMLVADLTSRIQRTNTLVWNAENLPAGVYMIRLTTANRSMTQKALLVR